MNWLQYLRIQRGLNQKQLAEHIGVNPDFLCRVERGWFSKPPSRIDAKLRAFFGPEWTFDRLMEPVPDITPDGRGPASATGASATTDSAA